MSVFCKALVDFADVKAGDNFHAYVMPDTVIDRWKGYEGRLYYIPRESYDDCDTVILETEMFERVVWTFEDMMKEKIKHTSDGVPSIESLFKIFGEYQYDLYRDNEFDARIKTKYFYLDTSDYEWVMSSGIISIDGIDVAFFKQSGDYCYYKFFTELTAAATESLVKSFAKNHEPDYNVCKPGENLINFFI